VGSFGYNSASLMISRTSLLACLFVLMGCTSEWQASNQRDYKAKKFGYPHRDRAKIYVYREAGSLAGPSPWRSLKLFTVGLFLDGMSAATMEPKSFALLTVRPGPHTLVSRIGAEDAELTIDATGGWVYYVALEAGSPGSVTGTELLLVDRETGRNAIRDLRLISDPPPPLDPWHPPSAPPPPSADPGPTPARLSGRP
jgi:hypothetical protein